MNERIERRIKAGLEAKKRVDSCRLRALANYEAYGNICNRESYTNGHMTRELTNEIQNLLVIIENLRERIAHLK